MRPSLGSVSFYVDTVDCSTLVTALIVMTEHTSLPEELLYRLAIVSSVTVGAAGLLILDIWYHNIETR